MALLLQEMRNLRLPIHLRHLVQLGDFVVQTDVGVKTDWNSLVYKYVGVYTHVRLCVYIFMYTYCKAEMWYRVETHSVPYLHRSFSAKEPYD